MATDNADTTELDAFQRYFEEQLGGSLNGHSLAEAISEFREYQRELEDLREKIRLADESAEREGTIIMTDEVVKERHERLKKQLAEEGITE